VCVSRRCENAWATLGTFAGPSWGTDLKRDGYLAVQYILEPHKSRSFHWRTPGVLRR
jgi:hypothetical protein